MKGHKLIGWVIGVPLVIGALILIILGQEPERDSISRAMAAKSVALTVLSPQELKEWKQEYGASHFPAECVKEWYVPYLDYLYEQGILLEEMTPANKKTAEGALTFGEAEFMMNQMDPALGSMVKASPQNREKAFPQQRWWLLYDSILKRMDPEGQVRTEQMAVYGTPDNMQGVPAWTAYTSLGTLTFYGLALDPYLDHELTVYVREGELIHVLEDQGSETVYRNVWILDGDQRELMVYIGDIQRKIPFQKKSKKTEELIHHMADLKMEDGKIVKVSLKEETISGKVLSVREDAIELEEYGLVPLDEEYKVLKTYGDMERLGLSDVAVGQGMEEFVVADGKICGILILRELDPELVRVLLMNSNFQGIYHDEITLSSAEDITMLQGEKKTRIKAGEPFTIGAGDKRLEKGRMIFQADREGEISVSSIERGHGTPSYAGRLEIVADEGGLVLINELYLEDYLTKVVPSEMPPSYEMDALKAQAVCARTYTYVQMKSNTYSQYGAQIDDSTNFQVYNNVERNERTTEAVRSTYGKMLLYEGQPVTAYYFSTSCGVTADGSLWGNAPEELPYLKSVTLQPGRKTLNLKNEKDFSGFIKRKDYPSYDDDYPYYRWNLTTNGTVLTANIGGIGQVTDIQITERGSGGVAQTLLVTGTEGEKTISGQNGIRSALGDESLTIHRRDGKTVTGWASLPSGFLCIEDGGEDENGIPQFQIYGGGYGHGAGMSQNGAQGMAKDGYSWEEILNFFYEGITIDVLR